jgi:hypothetical protein
MHASEYGHTATVKLLLGAGADKEAKDKVREKKRAIHTHTHTCGWQDGLKEENVAFLLLREHFYMCSTSPSHTQCLPLTHLLFRLARFPHSSPLLIFLLLWCVPPSPSIVRVAKLRS